MLIIVSLPANENKLVLFASSSSLTLEVSLISSFIIILACARVCAPVLAINQNSLKHFGRLAELDFTFVPN